MKHTLLFTRAFLLMISLAIAMSGLGCSSVLSSMVSDALISEEDDEPGFVAKSDDPELLAASLPTMLLAVEGMISSDPDDEDLLLGAASLYTQYAYAFVQQSAMMKEEKDPDAYREGMALAKKYFRRARDYGMRAIAEEYDSDFQKKLLAGDPAAFEELDDKDAIPFLYWTAAPWAMLVTMSLDDLASLNDLKPIEAMMRHAFSLKPDWQKGTLHEFFISFEARGEFIGGSLAKAKEHYERALELTGGKKIGIYVTWAESVAVSQQDSATFHSLLDRVLAFDLDSAPEYRLVNKLSQQRAAWLKSRAEDLFVE